MARWIAFDEETTALAAERTRMAVEYVRGDPLEMALSDKKPSFVLLPGSQEGKTMLLTIRFQTAASTAARSADPVGYEPSGFLGLNDAPAFAEPATPPRKWWQRIFD